MSLAYAITSGTTTIEGGGTVPPPPAVTSAWLSGLGYYTMKYGTLWLAGYQGTLTPPTGTDTDHITAIRISRLVSGQRAELLTLDGPFPVGNPRAFKSDAIDVVFTGPVTLEFVTQNEDGSTATYTTTVSLTAPSEASVTAAEATPISTTRHQTDNRGIRSVLTFTPVISNPLWPMPITIWTNHPGGVRKHRGVYEMQAAGALQLGAVGTKSEYDIIPPTAADESWTLTFAIGSFDELTAPPASAKTSSAFTMLRPPAPGSTDATGAYVDAVTYAAGPGGTQMFGLPHIYVTLPLGSNNFLHGRLKLQTGTGTGGSFVPGGKHPTPWNVGDWVSDDSHAEGFYRMGTSNQIYCNVPNVWDVPSDGNTTHRFFWEVASRRDGGTDVQQNCWSSGVGVSTAGTAAYQDVVVDGTKSNIPTDSSLTRDASTGRYKLNTDNLSNLVLNPSFENDLAGWDLLVGTWSIESGLTPATGTVTGSKRLLGFAQYNQWGIRETRGHVTRPGDVWYLEAYAGVYNGPGTFYLKAEFLDADGVTVLHTDDVDVSVNPTTYTLLKGTAAHYTGASFVRVMLYLVGATDATGTIVDNLLMFRQTSTGGGTEPDGRGGVRVKPGKGQKIDTDGTLAVRIDPSAPISVNGSGDVILKLASGLGTDGSGNLKVKNGGSITFDGAGNVVANPGPGLTFNAGGALVPNQGATVGVNASGQLIVPSGSLGLAEFNGTYQPYAIYFGLPSITASVPKMIINSSTTPWTLWKQEAGVWRAVLDSRDIVANTLVALSAVISPAISGGTIVGADISVVNGATTVTINGTSFVALTNSSSSTRVAMIPGASIVQSTVDANIYSQLSVDGSSGYVEVKDSAGNTSSLRAGTAASAGAGAATLPSNPVGFFKVRVNGTIRNVPFYS